MELIGYTTPEIRGMIAEGNKFIENVFREGKEIELDKFRVRSMKRGEGDDWYFCSCCLPQSAQRIVYKV
jgi:hypothetical protein